MTSASRRTPPASWPPGPRRSAAGRCRSASTAGTSPARPRRRCSRPMRRWRPSPRAPSAPSAYSETTPGGSAGAGRSRWARVSTNGRTSTRGGPSGRRSRSCPVAGRARSARAPSLLFRLAPSFSVTSSAYRAFRAPTLNELYRTFQVGDVVTLANDQLVAESVEGVEAGFLAGGGSLSLRATVFRMHLGDTVANVTLSAQPGLITRQRQNLGSVRSQGVEVDAEARAGRVVFSLGWLRADAEVRSFAADPTLVGLQVAQSPLNQAVGHGALHRDHRPDDRDPGAVGGQPVRRRPERLPPGDDADDGRVPGPAAGPVPALSSPPARTSSAAGTRSAGPRCSRSGRPGPYDSASGSAWPRARRSPRIEPHRLRWYKPLTDQDFGRQER